MTPEVSLVIPVWNEEGNVQPLYERARPVLDTMGRPWEMVFVDDGSTDDTFTLLRNIHSADKRVRVVRMRTNFGQTSALAAGFDLSRGEKVITMDGDLQNDPDDIPAIVAKMDEGFHVVSGWRMDRKENWIKRRLPSMAANGLISWLSGVKLHDYGCTLKGYHRDVVQNLHPYSDMHRFLPALASLAGARYTELPVKDHPRHTGESKYGLSRIGKVFIDLISLKMVLHFSTKPRYWFGYVSVPCVLAGSLLGCFALWRHLVAPPGTSFIILLGTVFLAFYLGFFLFSLGWIAELISATGTFRHSYRIDPGREGSQ